MTIAHLDYALQFFYDTKERYEYIEDIHKHIDAKYPVSIREALLIVQKLNRDGYVTLEIIKRVHSFVDSDIISEKNKSGYHISFEGIQFHEAGGYAALKEKQKTEYVFQKLKNDLEKAQIQSTIDTNRSVKDTNNAIQSNIPVQNRQTKISIGVAVVSLAFCNCNRI